MTVKLVAGTKVGEKSLEHLRRSSIGAAPMCSAPGRAAAESGPVRLSLDSARLAKAKD